MGNCENAKNPSGALFGRRLARDVGGRPWRGGAGCGRHLGRETARVLLSALHNLAGAASGALTPVHRHEVLVLEDALELLGCDFLDLRLCVRGLADAGRGAGYEQHGCDRQQPPSHREGAARLNGARAPPARPASSRPPTLTLALGGQRRTSTRLSAASILLLFS